MSTVVIVGTQWGDEGKGKIVDYLAEKAESVVRYQGGSNAGHTVAVNGKEYKLRLMPSGILYKGTHNIIANGVAFNPRVFLQEVEGFKKAGIDTSNIMISDRAHVVMPYHERIDELMENAKGKQKIGTTHNGIGPCYVDRDHRIGIRVCDLLEEEVFKDKLQSILEMKNHQITKLYNAEEMNYNQIVKEYLDYAEKIRPYVVDTITLLNDEIKSGRKILFEGAQATMLDIDYGTYPYVTASHPVSGGITIGAGVAPQKIDKVVGVVKAYCTRVGEGPFPTEDLGEAGNKLRETGHEYGTVTGRPRRTGWLDACVVKYAGILSGINYIAITRLDILDDFDEIKLCVGYKYKGKVLNGIPASLSVLSEVEPVWETFKGWKKSISKIRKYEDLPQETKAYLKRIEEVTDIKIGIVSVGPNRDETITVATDIF